MMKAITLTTLDASSISKHYNDVIMSPMASQITSPAILYSTVYSGADQRKYQSSASLAFVRVIHRWPVNSPHKRPVTRKMFPFDDVLMNSHLNTHPMSGNMCYYWRMVSGNTSYTITDTERSSWWRPWYSLETLKIIFNVFIEYRGSHPDDLFVSVYDIFYGVVF